MIRGLCLLVACFSTPALAVDLLDLYRLARDNDTRTAAARADYRAALERVPQAKAGALPDADVGLKRVKRGGNRRYHSPGVLQGTQDLNGNGAFATTGRLR